MKNLPNRIVFYDGDCGFCNRTVQFVLKNDKSHSIHFLRIQSDLTVEIFKRLGFSSPDLSTFYFLEDEQLHEKSTAALRLSRYMSFPAALSRVFWIVPRVIRDQVYDSVAKRRQRLMKGYCVIPDEEQQKLFL